MNLRKPPLRGGLEGLLMAMDNNIKNYTAADIEKYHKGLLSAKEMHDMEKAALDDPFLADALEGYATEGVNVQADIADLKKRLEEKTERAKVIPMTKGGKNSFPFLRVAVMVVIIAGAALLTYQFAFNKKDQTIASLEKSDNNEKSKAADTINNNNASVTPDNSRTTGNESTGESTNAAGKSGNTGTTAENDIKDAIVSGEKKNDISEVPDVKTKPAETAPIARATDTSKNYKTESTDITRAKNLDLDAGNDQVAVAAEKKEKDLEKSKKVVEGLANPTASRRSDDQSYQNMVTNTFRGRVTDSRNVGVPFANVTNLVDNAGTYTDANGYFNLTYPDTLLNVQVRSVGFENNVSMLKNNIGNNQVVLHEDRRSLSEVVISNKQVNTAARSRDNNRTLEEPEPADGWEKYDTYIANNLNVPDEARTKPSGNPAVEISFEVDKNGEPINIKVEKSLCSKCDQEAIRLIKDGPKWKRKANKSGRTTVTISF